MVTKMTKLKKELLKKCECLDCGKKYLPKNEYDIEYYSRDDSCYNCTVNEMFDQRVGYKENNQRKIK